MHRLEEENRNREWITRKDVERAIMIECGIDNRTLYNNFKALKALGWIKCDKKMIIINREADYD